VRDAGSQDATSTQSMGNRVGGFAAGRHLCAKAPVVLVEYTGQNGKTYSQSVKVKAACSKKSKRTKRHQGSAAPTRPRTAAGA
jgi:hypothetical protein